MSFASAALVPAPPEVTFCATQVANPTAAKSAVVARSPLMDPPSLQEREKTLCHSVRRSRPESYNSTDARPHQFQDEQSRCNFESFPEPSSMFPKYAWA